MGLQCTSGIEGSNNCNCKYMNTIRQKFSCTANLKTQPHKASKAHFWCLCGAKPTLTLTASLYPVSRSQCQAASKKNTGSCSNSITCPMNDGACAINVYGYRSSDKGMTCDKACAKIGLACSLAMESRGSCNCGVPGNNPYQTFDCGTDLSKQPHVASKAYFWCMCGSKQPPVKPAIMPVSKAQCSSLKYTVVAAARAPPAARGATAPARSTSTATVAKIAA
jgi:hypothetical protein